MNKIKKIGKALFLAAWDDRITCNILLMFLLFVGVGFTLLGFLLSMKVLFFTILLTIVISYFLFFAIKIISKLAIIFWISAYSTKLLFAFIIVSIIFIVFILFEIHTPTLIDCYVNEVIQGKIDEFLIGIIIGFVVAHLTDKLITKLFLELEYNKELKEMTSIIEGDAHSKEDEEKAMIMIERLVKKSHIESQYYLGMAYLNGKKYIQRDIKKANKILQKAAERRHKKAIIALGEMRYEGQDHKKAFKWYRKVAKQGNVIGQFNFAFAYYEGLGVRRSYRKAFKWFYKSAIQGHAESQYYLGRMYERGQGVRKDLNQASVWYIKSNDQGNNKAGFALGVM